MRSNYTPACRTSTVSIFVQLTALIFMFFSMLALAAGMSPL